MYKDYRIVVVTPAGRKEYLECLVKQVLALCKAGFVDEYQLWMHTTNTDDIEYINSLELIHKKINIRRLPDGMSPRGNTTISHFYRDCTDSKTVYIKLDDDIVLLDDIEAFVRFLDFRISNPDYFIICANILNNAIISYILQHTGKLDNSTENGLVSYTCMDQVGWKNPQFAEKIHRQIIASDFDLSKFRVNTTWNLCNNERISINCISWLGSSFAKFDGLVGSDDEQWLCEDKPRMDGLRNIVFLDYVVVHFAFYTQRNYLKSTDILDAYRNHLGLVNKKTKSLNCL